jgi:hypothetical protein
MNLSEAGESRIRGYLFMLESSLRTFLKRDVAADAVREVESHIRERVRETAAMPNERDALNRLLDALGPPHRRRALGERRVPRCRLGALHASGHGRDPWLVGNAGLCGARHHPSVDDASRGTAVSSAREPAPAGASGIKGQFVIPFALRPVD